MPLPAWTPDLPALDLLLSVAELGSIGAAATVHGISQPSASARLARLERQVGTALLVRSPRGSALTVEGEAVAAWARSVIQATVSLTDGVVGLRADRAARLRVAASLTVAEYLLPSWLLLLRRRHPGLDVAVSVANSSGVAEQVRTGQAVVGFVESPEAPAGLSATEVGRDRIAFVVAAGYPLAARAARRLRVADLLDQPLLLREPGSGTRETFLHALGHPELPHATELGSTAMIVATALAGGGVAVISSRAVAQELATGRLVEVHLDASPLERPLRAVWAGRQPNPLARELILLASSSAG